MQVEWMPTSQEVPEEGSLFVGFSDPVFVTYLSYFDKKTPFVGVQAAIFDVVREYWYWYDLDFSPSEMGKRHIDVEIVAWMPMPEPYKAGGAGG